MSNASKAYSEWIRCCAQCSALFSLHNKCREARNTHRHIHKTYDIQSLSHNYRTGAFAWSMLGCNNWSTQNKAFSIQAAIECSHLVTMHRCSMQQRSTTISTISNNTKNTHSKKREKKNEWGENGLLFLAVFCAVACSIYLCGEWCAWNLSMNVDHKQLEHQ